jgi:hypothetical protein
MAFTLNPTRKFTVKYSAPSTEGSEPSDSFEADFEFILTEDCFTEDVRKKVKELKPILNSDTEEVKTSKMYKQQSVIWHKIRRSLKAVRGINDFDGNPISIADENFNINTDVQAAVFEFITNFDDVATQILSAYMGLNLKNSKAGATK